MTKELNQFQCFTPIYGSDCRLLIIGSLPGETSFAQSQYYAHPSNDFWLLIGALLKRDLRRMDYEARLEALLEAKIGLWDSIRSASRRRSDDSSVRNAATNNLAQIADGLKHLECIAFNGKTAAVYGRRGLSPYWMERCQILPSSSGAARMPFQQKLSAWKAVSPFIETGHGDADGLQAQIPSPMLSPLSAHLAEIGHL